MAEYLRNFCHRYSNVLIFSLRFPTAHTRSPPVSKYASPNICLSASVEHSTFISGLDASRPTKSFIQSRAVYSRVGSCAPSVDTRDSLFLVLYDFRLL